MLNWKTTKADMLLIGQITKRARKMYAKMGRPVDGMQVNMDVTAAHSNGCRLKLQELLDADDGNFAHDIGGIMRHLDRTTGKLGDCFLPRCAV